METAKRKVQYLLITIIILIFLAWGGLIVLMNVGSKPGGPMLQTLSVMHGLSYAVKSYYEQYGILQTNREALEICVGGQVKLTDYWGNPFHLKVGQDTQWIEIISFGADGLPGDGSKYADTDLVITQMLTRSYENQR